MSLSDTGNGDEGNVSNVRKGLESFADANPFATEKQWMDESVRLHEEDRDALRERVEKLEAALRDSNSRCCGDCGCAPASGESHAPDCLVGEALK
jgi:hypothetical protein